MNARIILPTGKSSEKTDVFGYGVMLLELITGQRAFDLARLANDDDVMLLDWESGKEGCTMHVSPDQLWPHTKVVNSPLQLIFICFSFSIVFVLASVIDAYFSVVLQNFDNYWKLKQYMHAILSSHDCWL